MKPQMRRGAMPGAMGWIEITERHGRAASPPVAAAAHDLQGDVRGVSLETQEMRPRHNDPDAPTLARSAHDANPPWSAAQIADDLGLPPWYVNLVLEASFPQESQLARL